jgi:hypothetical protein
MNRNKLPLDPCHLGVPSGAPNTIFEPIARSVQTLHLSCVEINTISKQTEASFHFTHITYESHQVRAKMICKPIARLAQTMQPSCVKISTISKGTEMSDLRHLGVPSFVPKMIFKPVACPNLCTYLAPRLTVSKWLETSFHMTHVT